MKPVFMLDREASVINAIATFAGLLLPTANHVLMKLFTNDITPNIAMTLADFTEATFTGYAPAQLPAPTEGITPDGRHQAAYRGIDAVKCTGEPGSPTTVFGWYIEYDTAPWVIMAKRFDHPIVVHLGTIIPMEAALVLPLDLCDDDGIAT